MLIFREQQLPQIFGQLNANVSSLLFSQIKTQIMNQYYKKFNPGLLALKIGQTWDIPIILFFYS